MLLSESGVLQAFSAGLTGICLGWLALPLKGIRVGSASRWHTGPIIILLPAVVLR